MSRWRTLALELVPVASALLLALACASSLVLAYGQAPLDVYRLFFAGTWGTGYGIGQVLFKVTPLVLTGLSVSLAMEAGLLNVGREGQLALGAFSMGIVGASLPPGTPGPVAVALCLLAGFVGGAAAGGVAGVLKAWRGAHEVIVTIMLNFVILAKLSDWGQRFTGVGAGMLLASVYGVAVLHFRADQVVSGVGATLLAAGATRFCLKLLYRSASNSPRIEAQLSPWPLVALALVLAAACAWLLSSTRLGLRLRAAGEHPEALRALGIRVLPLRWWGVLASGALGGLGGVWLAFDQHQFVAGMSAGRQTTFPAACGAKL